MKARRFFLAAGTLVSRELTRFFRQKNRVIGAFATPLLFWFFPLRVDGIFTATSISPSSLLRQSPNRYSIRAGRNLPDKEFRYLRTVIVTAAVYRGFGSMLRLH